MIISYNHFPFIISHYRTHNTIANSSTHLLSFKLTPGGPTTLTNSLPQWDWQSVDPTVSLFITASPNTFIWLPTCLYSMVHCDNFSFNILSTFLTLLLFSPFHWLLLLSHFFGSSTTFWLLKFKIWRGLAFRPLFFSIYTYFLENLLPGHITTNTIFMLCRPWEKSYLM